MLKTDFSISREILKTYRIALLIVAIIFPIVGLFTNYYDSEMYDPLIFRLIIGLVVFSLFIGSYLSIIVIEKFFVFFYFLLLIILVWTCFIAFKNEFSFSTTFFYIAAISIISFSLNSHKYVLTFLLATTVLTAISLYTSSLEAINSFALIISIVSIQLVAFIIVRWKTLTEQKLKLYSNELKQNNSDKDRFMQILSHDLKSPISSMLGHTELLLKNIRKYDIGKIENRIVLIDNIAENTYTLLDNILIWANSQSGKIQVERQKISVLDICDNIIHGFKGFADYKNIEIICSIDPNTIIFADLNMFNTILRNLISNAIKFSNKGGIVNISSFEDAKTITIKVADNGIGITNKEQENLWNNNSNTVPSIGTNNEQGTGLGLVLCKEFVEKHNGKIWVESELGKGSIFSFTLPKD
jgi:signal transduction histidine kinase